MIGRGELSLIRGQPERILRTRHSILYAVAVMIPLTCALAGCDKSAPTSTTTPSAPASPVVQGPTTAPTTAPATQPAVSSMLINQLFAAFPGAELRLETDGDHLTAILYSADPPTAINNDYSGNSYYLRMSLEQVKDASGLNGAEWRFKALSSDRSDSHDGIFLNGTREQLQPIDVIVRFETIPQGVRVRLAGEFMEFGNSPGDQPGILTSVSGDLTASVELAKQP